MYKTIVTLLKTNKFIYLINSGIKSKLLSIRSEIVRNKNNKACKRSNIEYKEEKVIEDIRQRLKKNLNLNIHNSSNKKLNVFWIGTNYDQDFSGMIQELGKLCDLRIYYRNKNTYGFVSNTNKDLAIVKRENDISILESVRIANEQAPIDIIIGQFWANYISSSTLKSIKEMGIIIINISMDDRLPEMWKPNSGAQGLGDSQDLVLTTMKESCEWYEQRGISSIYWQLASSGNIFFPNDYKDIDVSFIGNNYGYRGKLISHLLNNNIKVEAYGNGWPNGYANQTKSREILSRSKISIGVGTIGHSRKITTMKLRDFDVPMSGAVYITTFSHELQELYKKNEEIMFYRSPDELKEKINYLLNNNKELEKIGQNGRNRALLEHSWEHRFNFIFDIING